MDWKSARIILASTATLVVASQVVKSLYKRFLKPKKSTPDINEDMCNEDLCHKTKEINDVLLFTDDIFNNTLKIAPNKSIILNGSRELNCFKLIKYIASARETLDVCMYLISSSEIAEHIIRLGQRHVLVRIIVDSEMADSPPSQVKKLKEFSFITVQTEKRSVLMHHKFCIVDGPDAIKRKKILKDHAEKLNIQVAKVKPKPQPKPKAIKGFVMSGSLNWSTQAMISNNESVIVTSNPNIVHKFEKEFDSLWVENEPVLTNTQTE